MAKAIQEKKKTTVTIKAKNTSAVCPTCGHSIKKK